MLSIVPRAKIHHHIWWGITGYFATGGAGNECDNGDTGIIIHMKYNMQCDMRYM